MDISYQELISRNWLFINEALQTKIANTSLFFAGCGLGSVIAETAARIGFSNFILADGDTVELSNLNRQIFTTADIGKNKAESTAEVLLRINPLIKSKVINSFLDSSNFKDLAEDSDYVINTIDVNKNFFEINKKSTDLGKTVFLPLNIGFGSFLMILTKDSKRMDEMFDVDKINNDLDFFRELISKLGTKKLPEYLSSKIQYKLEEIGNKKISPQLSIGANLTASLTITNIIKLIDKGVIPVSPNPILIDLFDYK